MIALGIDTSCDDTGVGVVRDGEVLANVVASQTELHAEFGGVVPEYASREHTRVIDGLVERALDEARVPARALDLVAATYGPGLVGPLLVGLSYAKGLALGLGVPFYGIHHLEAHLAAARAGAGGLEPPYLALLASGGHTHLFDVPREGEYRLLGATRDDAAGEAFDKVARLLGLGYPGGPRIAKLAEQGDDRAVPFPLPLKGQEGFDFSFSGLKTAAARFLEKGYRKEDLAASFERAVVESLVQTAVRAARRLGRDRVVVAGGVAANARLRRRFAETGLELFLPPPELATDNGAMVALAALERVRRGEPPSPWTIEARPYAPLAEASHALDVE